MPITITTADIYGEPNPKIPDGWEAGELILCVRGGTRTVLTVCGNRIGESACVETLPRLELRRVEYDTWTIKCKKGVVPIVYVPTGEVRVPKDGEWLMSCGDIVRADGYIKSERPIFTSVTPERAPVNGAEG